LAGNAAFFARDSIQALKREIDRRRADRAKPDQQRNEAAESE
jgi:hypothetical protein